VVVDEAEQVRLPAGDARAVQGVLCGPCRNAEDAAVRLLVLVLL
jgi:hypothetical protein